MLSSMHMSVAGLYMGVQVRRGTTRTAGGDSCDSSDSSDSCEHGTSRESCDSCESRGSCEYVSDSDDESILDPRLGGHIILRSLFDRSVATPRL